MRIFDNPLIGLLIMASIIIMGFTVLFLSIQGRPDAPPDLIAQVDPAGQGGEQAPVETAVPIQGETMTGTAFIEGEPIILEPNPAELVQRVDAIMPVGDQPPMSGGTDQIVINPVDPMTQEQPQEQPTVEIIVQEVTPEPVVAADAAPTAVPQPVITSVDPIIYQSHIVAAGDTLYNIARRYNTGVELMAEKGISSRNLVAGNQIMVPIPNPDYCPGLVKVVVREGDTVFRIATNYNRTVEQVRAANNLNQSYTINIGQVLCIP